jgi:hypothetical protein
LNARICPWIFGETRISGEKACLEGPIKNQHGHRKQDNREQQQEFDGRKQLRQASATKKRRAHGVQRVSHGIQFCYDLQPIRKDSHRKKHAAGNTPQTDEQPFSGIAAFEQR